MYIFTSLIYSDWRQSKQQPNLCVVNCLKLFWYYFYAANVLEVCRATAF